MFKITRIDSAFELFRLWPRLVKCAKKDNPELSIKTYLDLLLRCFGWGAVFVVRGNEGVVGACGIELADDLLLLRAIPNDRGTGLAKVCIDEVKKFAVANNCDKIQVTTKKFSGASFHYFEKTLGLRRYSVTFSMKV
jgi:hypothetical protein